MKAHGSMHDLGGWEEISCAQRDDIRQAHPESLITSSLTDIDGVHGYPVIYTEWGVGDVAMLRDYLYDPQGRDRRCRHFRPREAP